MTSLSRLLLAGATSAKLLWCVPTTLQAQITLNDDLEVAPADADRAGFRHLAGKPVHSANGERLGVIHDFVIEKRTGEIVYAVVSTGGVFGIGRQLRLVPLRSLQPAPNGDEGFTVRVSRNDWEQAPALERDGYEKDLLHLSEPAREELAAFYESEGRELPRRHERIATDRVQPRTPEDKRDAERAASPYRRLSKFADRDLQAEGREFGEVEDVIVDLPRARAALLVELEDELTGDGDEVQVLLPLRAIDFEREGEDLFTSISAEQVQRIAGAPRSEGAHGRAAPAADRAAPVTEREERLLPTGRGDPKEFDSSPDATLASAARSARQMLDQHGELSRADITVKPENGRLVLTGKVASNRLRELAASAVGDAAGRINIDNRLEVDP